ncbi:MAG: GNAT family N-acetyltransferase [Anaerolineae bacterium]|nr:GNAT family N-acetyltransferase [Anaerolineae bacterium]
MLIDLAHLDDAQDILELQKLAYQSEAALYDDYSIPPLTQTLEQMQADMRQQVVFNAVLDGKNVGSVRGYLRRGTCYIGRLIVHPNLQNQGIGQALLSTIEKHFHLAHRFELFTGDRSERNLYLYTKCGYTVFRSEQLTGKTTIVFLEKVPHAEEPRYTLESTLADVTAWNLHGEVDIGAAAGGEAW